MKSRILIIVAAITVAASSSANAGFFTYQEWLKYPPQFRTAYIAGAFDTLTAIANSEDDLARINHQNACIKNAQMTLNQLADNVIEFSKNKPEIQTGSVAEALARYLYAACGLPPQSRRPQ